MAKGFGQQTPVRQSKIERQLSLGLQQQQAGNLSEAIRICEAILHSEPAHPGALYLRGLIAHQTGDYLAAIEWISQAIGQDPAFVPYHTSIALAYIALNRLPEAASHYQKAIQLQPDLTSAHNNLGTVLRNLGQPVAAMLHYQQAILSDPKSPDAYNNLGSVLADQGDMEKAKALFLQAIQRNPLFPEAHLNSGNAWQSLKDYSQAIDAYQTALRIQPDLNEARYQLGISQWKAQLQSAAAVTLQQVLDRQPDHVHARYVLAMMGVLPMPDKTPPEWVTKLFDDYAPRFDTHLIEKLNYRTPDQLHQLVVDHTDPTLIFEQALDLGCGTGLCGRLFRDRVRRLVGVDLSAGMIDRASQLGVYDHLLVADLLVPLAVTSPQFDLVLAADVFVYVGELSAIFAGCQQSMIQSGYFAFSVEIGLSNGSGAGYQLGATTGRYIHSPDYIQGLAAAHQFQIRQCQETTLRTEESQPVQGHLWLLQRL